MLPCTYFKPNLKIFVTCLLNIDISYFRFTTFPEEKELWIEIKAVTTALRLFEKADQTCENLEKSITPESDFLRQLFYQLPKTIQHALLLACAEKTPDNMEHCKLMLLLFLKFPGTVAKFGVSKKYI